MTTLVHVSTKEDHPMRVPAFIVLASLTVVPAQAQHSGKRDHANHIAICQAWREHVTQVIDLRVYTRSLSEEEAHPIRAVIKLLGQSCLREDPRRISTLFVAVLDLLEDTPNQQ
jgi:hypothetical protein